MKAFKKKRHQLPHPGSVARMIRKNLGVRAFERYQRELRIGLEFPLAIREVTLCRLHPQDKQKVMYYPDLRNFSIVLEPNRVLPIRKFLDLFINMVDQPELEQTHDTLTSYRLEFNTTPEDWIRVYRDENVHSCMSQSEYVKCYVHPENKLALAALYAPGGRQVIARSIVNMDEKWYVRLFGDPTLVHKLNELGYNRLTRPPAPFKMFAAGRPDSGAYDRNNVILPFFDFPYNECTHHPETFDPATRMFEVTVS